MSWSELVIVLMSFLPTPFREERGSSDGLFLLLLLLLLLHTTKLGGALEI